MVCVLSKNCCKNNSLVLDSLPRLHVSTLMRQFKFFSQNTYLVSTYTLLINSPKKTNIFTTFLVSTLSLQTRIKLQLFFVSSIKKGTTLWYLLQHYYFLQQKRFPVQKQPIIYIIFYLQKVVILQFFQLRSAGLFVGSSCGYFQQCDFFAFVSIDSKKNCVTSTNNLVFNCCDVVKFIYYLYFFVEIIINYICFVQIVCIKNYIRFQVQTLLCVATILT
eukprot:TRINITY_DN10364_c0_g2_i4.p2 TRINITY_DN10364_c0_g2~~TRINITY_DN10364_c0_g2_i4.p2  ORF type:complete len:219 (+),score=-13.12 TRINITY_DN10364_c0_g2_i4:341-997(+)